MSRQLFKSIFRPTEVSIDEFSPVTSLAHTLNTASIRTPCKRLSLSSLVASDASCDLDIPSDFNYSAVFNELPEEEVEIIYISPPLLKQLDEKENRKSSKARRKRRRSPGTPLRQLQNCHINYSPSQKCKKPKQNSKMKYDCIPLVSRDSGFSESISTPSLPIFRKSNKIRKLDFDSPTEDRKFRSFATLTTTMGEDEFVMELISNTPKPTHFSTLMSAPITTPEPPTPRQPSRRCLSLFDATTPSRKMEVSPCRPGPLALSSPKQDNVQSYQLKRPCSPIEWPVPTKRRKIESDCSPLERALCSPIPRRSPLAVPSNSPTIQRFVSDSHVAIMKALNKCDSGEQLTGDFSRPLALPIEALCRNPELKSISPQTLSDLLLGKYEETVDSFEIMDCRYPYEYNGGHIKGAINWPTLESASKFFDSVKGLPEIVPVSSGRRIIIFHCEFSAERGPKAQRYLREVDRTAHREDYPALCFPELYLLEGGYKSFFANFPDMCSPQSYTRMLDHQFSADMKVCRAQSKTFANESKFGMGKLTVARTKSSKRNFRLRNN